MTLDVITGGSPYGASTLALLEETVHASRARMSLLVRDSKANILQSSQQSFLHKVFLSKLKKKCVEFTDSTHALR